MARPLRINRAGVWFHVVARGTDRKDIFGQDADWRHWLELLAKFAHRFRLRLHAYVMMSNHYHLLLETPEANLSEAMQWFKKYRVYAGREKQPDWLTCEKVLELGGKGTRVQRQQAYERYVEEAVWEGLAVSPWEEPIGGLMLGSRQFAAKVQKGLGLGREQPQSRSLRPRPQWKEVIAAVESVRGMGWEELQSQRGDWGRDLSWYLGRRECGLSLRELGEVSGGVDYATVSAAAKRIERRFSMDKGLAQKAKRVQKKLKQSDN